MSKIDKVAKALRGGEILTAADMKKRFGVKNARALTSSLRLNKGMTVKSERMKAGNNKVVTLYSAGRTPREVVAAGYQALARGLV